MKKSLRNQILTAPESNQFFQELSQSENFRKYFVNDLLNSPADTKTDKTGQKHRVLSDMKISNAKTETCAVCLIATPCRRPFNLCAAQNTATTHAVGTAQIQPAKTKYQAAFVN